MQPLPHCVYVLYSLKDGNLYIGYSTDLDQRILAHQNGEVRSTSSRRPLRLIYCEFHGAERDARRRENYFKSSKGKTTLRRVVAAGMKLLPSALNRARILIGKSPSVGDGDVNR